MGYIEGEDRNQIILFPESIDEYVSDNNSIRIIDEYIKQLDLEILGFKRAVNIFIDYPNGIVITYIFIYTLRKEYDLISIFTCYVPHKSTKMI